jgi:FAD/FMN-containing dehydrogenase
MRRVVVDPVAGRVDVGPGSLLKEVDRATQEHGRATVLGFVSETGVAGLTLGGGFGYLTRRFGWVVDNLEEVEIVTADGEIRRANREENGDLFWAIRGAGHNFGVVTRFTFRLHEVGPAVTGGLIGWSAERADDVLAAYRELTESGPRELTAAAVIRLAPAAPFVPDEWRWKPMIGILLCHSGPDPEGDLGPLRTLGDPIFDTVGPKPYVVQQSLVDALEPRGFARYWKSEYLPGLPADFLEAFRESALALTSPMSQSLIFQLGGALRDREYDDGAVGNRDAEYTSGFNATWLPNASAEEHVAWARQGWESIRPFSTGGNYVNFQLAEDDVARTAAAYGKNYARLERLKAKYDPANVFRVNRNISPAA